MLRRTTVFGYYDDNHLLAVERRTNHLGAEAPENVSRERVWRIRARRVVLATGAHERSLAFADNDRPGVMLAASARTLRQPPRRPAGPPGGRLHHQRQRLRGGAGPRRGGRGTSRRSSTPAPNRGSGPSRARAAGIEVLPGHAVTGTEGDARLTAVTAAPYGESARQRQFAADLLLVSGGWNPVAHLFSQAGGRLRYDETLGSFVPDTCRQAVEVAGSASGVLDLAAVLAQGAAAGVRAVEAEGYTPQAPRLPAVAAQPQPTPPMHVYAVPDASGAPRFVDLQRDVTVDDLARATGAGMRSVEHTKRYTTAGTANDQGKTSGVLASGSGRRTARRGHLGARHDHVPAAVHAGLLRRTRGPRPRRAERPGPHDRHPPVACRARRPVRERRPVEAPLVLPAGRRGHGEPPCCASAPPPATSVAFMDASTLGKIDVQGPDAGVFLDLLYTNMMSTLKVGMIRYGVMCRPDGMIFDDGTVIRLAQDRFLVTTTTGNAAAVLDWMEEWLQTEWPDLKVHCTSVTEQWATVALVGPRSRDVLGSLAPQLAVANDDFPFMAWRETTVAGIEARVCRISFSGELAYEINVSPWEALALWEALHEAGAPYGITPYGTETMHVLRAEKGYPIIGQDTDGTVTPQDLGMSWVVSKKKPDFIGKRSYARADTVRPDRKHLVGLLPDDPGTFLPEGTHLVADSVLPAPPVPMLGHVTSSYRSAALGRTFALALIKGGRDRIGERLYAPVGDRLVPVTVASPVLYDPEGARRDG